MTNGSDILKHEERCEYCITIRDDIRILEEDKEVLIEKHYQEKELEE